jgi:hypothetical protein
MGPGSFDDFVQREIEAARKAGRDSIDWEAEKSEWLRHLDDLYYRVKMFLKQYIDAGQITTRFGTVELNEEHLGPYTAPSMIITIGAKAVALEPVGTVMAGSRGRIDVTCNLARGQMILIESGTVAQLIPSSGIGRTLLADKKLTEGRWIWKIVTRDTQDLTREAFLGLLLEIAKG